LFIAFLGFQNVDLIQYNEYTLVQLFDFHGEWIKATQGGSLFDAWCAIVPVVLTILGLCVMGVLSQHKVKGSVIFTILGTTVLYYFFTWQLPVLDFTSIGDSFKSFGTEGLFGAFTGFKTLFTTGGVFTWGTLFSVISLTITFCLVDMFDTMGTLYAAASQATMLDENGDPVNLKQSMNSDSIATITGSLLGTSTCTTFVESSVGVGVGGRTGFASLITASCFFVCLFLTPVATIIPACATAPALIYIGVLMLKGFAKVDMEDLSSAIPAFLTLVMMPLTYSISNGIAIGAISYVLIRLITGKFQKKDITVTIIAILFALRFALITW
jgi:AGZA family xanthine/uracil permease-like MFS transporter